MIEQEDYIKRQIDQLGRVLGKVLFDFLGLKNNGQVSVGTEMASRVLKNELNFDIQELINIPTNSFVDTLLSEERLNNDNFEKLAEILLVVADDKESAERKIFYKKCLAIYEYLERAESIYSFDRQWKIEKIKECL